jgi:hypothetical protein
MYPVQRSVNQMFFPNQQQQTLVPYQAPIQLPYQAPIQVPYQTPIQVPYQTPIPPSYSVVPFYQPQNQIQPIMQPLAFQVPQVVPTPNPFQYTTVQQPVVQPIIINPSGNQINPTTNNDYEKFKSSYKEYIKKKKKPSNIFLNNYTRTPLNNDNYARNMMGDTLEGQVTMDAYDVINIQNC